MGKLSSLVSISISILGVVALAGCKKKADCAGVVGAAVERTIADATKGLSADARKQAETSTAKLKDAAIARCTEDKWSSEVVSCMAAGKTADDFKKCGDGLTVVQGKALDAAMAALDGAGAACPAVGEAVDRMMADTVKDAPQRDKDAAAAQAKVMKEVALKRCAEDKWSAAAIKCIANVSGEDVFQHCESKLTAAQRASVDSAMTAAIAAMPPRPGAGSGSAEGSGEAPHEGSAEAPHEGSAEAPHEGSAEAPHEGSAEGHEGTPPAEGEGAANGEATEGN